MARDIAGHGPIERLLDIGTGPGRLLAALHAVLPEAELVGVDISAAMVAKARRNLAQMPGREKVTLEVCGANRLPFPDGMFDCVVSTGSLHHWKDAAAGLNEAHRVLRPGRCALIYDLVRHVPEPVAKWARSEFGAFRAALMWLHSFEEPFLDPEDMLALARQTRFGGGETLFVGMLCCLVLRKK